MSEDLSDEQLMLMFRYGNRAAFGLLFEKYRGPVFGFARRMLGSTAGAEDACQEVFLKVVSAAADYEPTAKFRTWLFTIARNCCLNTLRRPRPLSLIEEVAVEDRQSADPRESASEAETEELLEEAIADLPDTWREAFLLRSRHGLDYREIAQVTEQPVGTVKTHIHRARLQLAEAMQELLHL